MTAFPFNDLTPEEACAFYDRIFDDMHPCGHFLASKVGSADVLDYGCGPGESARHYLPKQYYGVDVSQPLIDEARRRHPHYRFHVIPPYESVDMPLRMWADPRHVIRTSIGLPNTRNKAA